ncbi:MAG: DUF371 domain-containing protein [Candidatus Hadarchaeales archaeon]
MKWKIEARGHPRITATHPTTFMFTKEKEIFGRGNCIVGVEASASAAELPKKLKQLLQQGRKINIILSTGSFSEKVVAEGATTLTFTNTLDVVVRKSDYVCGRTVAIKANKAAADFSRDFVEYLRNPSVRVRMEIEAI